MIAAQLRLNYRLPMFRFLYVFMIFMAFSLQVTAQVATEQSLTITPSGEAYLKATGSRGIDRNVVYFDPTKPPPALETDQKPEKPVTETSSGTGGWAVSPMLGIFAAALLVGVGFLAYSYGGGFAISVKGDAENPARRARPTRMSQQAINQLPSDLATIVNMDDRREALIALAQSALARAVSANGLLMQRSWTARDALRRLPVDQLHRSVLADLVAAGERVHFGGRDVPEDVFDAYVTKIKPLFYAAAK